ncbi:MAG: hypothetical protein ABI347_08230 [Nitrososphaera sp.]
MSSYRMGERMTLPYDLEPDMFAVSGPTAEERLIERAAHVLCEEEEGFNYRAMTPIQRLFLTHYRCSFCKLLPVYNLDLSSPRKARCGKCGHLISFSGTGKYGKMRKKLALVIWQARKGVEP